MNNECVSLIANWITIVGFPIAVVAVVIAVCQFRRTKNVEEARFWLDLRQAFRVHDEVHLNLRPGGKWCNGSGKPQNPEDWAKIDAYLGQFELCEIMLQKKLINKNIFKSQYHYRINNIVQNKDIVNNKILDPQEDWGNFKGLCGRCKVVIERL